VVGGAAGEILIGAGGGDEVAVAELVAADFEADRCVLQTRFMHLHPVVGLRRFDALEVGEAVYAIGNPRRLERTLSEGLLSGKRTGTDQRLLQTTAPISPGSSGGGLFDRQGNLLGITSSTLRGAQNVNFAVPAEDFWK
jgi:S1-C subfamily serine protease